MGAQPKQIIHCIFRSAAFGLTISGLMGGAAAAYPQSVKEQYYRTCLGTEPDNPAHMAGCSCFVDKMVKTIPYAEFKRLDRSISEGTATMADIAWIGELRQACIDELGLVPTP